jgi:hypothetical protein
MGVGLCFGLCCYCETDVCDEYLAMGGGMEGAFIGGFCGGIMRWALFRMFLCLDKEDCRVSGCSFSEFFEVFCSLSSEDACAFTALSSVFAAGWSFL